MAALAKFLFQLLMMSLVLLWLEDIQKDGMRRVLAGETTLDELLRVTQEG